MCNNILNHSVLQNIYWLILHLWIKQNSINETKTYNYTYSSYVRVYIHIHTECMYVYAYICTYVCAYCMARNFQETKTP